MITQKRPTFLSPSFGRGTRVVLAASAVVALQFPSTAQANESQKLDAFAAKIERAFQKRCVGFGYAVYKNGSFVRGGGGGSREKVDSIYGDHPFNENTQKDCHSMSKTISAAAMIKALQLRGFSLQTKIYDFFPREFQLATPGGQSPSNISNALIKGITFEQMLAHKSGFAQSAKSWNQLKAELQGGLDYAPRGDNDDSVYANWNYGMCRLLIPYVMHTTWFRDLEKTASKEQLESITADMYRSFTRNEILKPAGAYQTRTRPPQDPTAANFAYLYDFKDEDEEGIMPNRTLDVGSGGWAMSAKEFAKFIDALFDEELVSPNVVTKEGVVNTLDYMQDKRLGMFTRWGSDGQTYYNHRGANSWSNNGQSVGGKSVWMHYPGNDMTVVVQINSHANAITAYGVERAQILQEAYDEVYSSPTSSERQHPLNLFVSRSQDGWMASRGVAASSGLSATDFDVDDEAGWKLTRFYTVSGRSFMLRYNPDNGQGNGSAVVRRMAIDGTIAETTLESDSWRRGWTNAEIFHKNNAQDAYLLLYNKTSGKLRTYRLANDGTPISPAITDVDATPGFDVLEIARLSSQDHLVRYNSTSGLMHVRRLNNNGSWGAEVYEKTWKKGFTSFNFYQTGDGNQYLLRYQAENGHANILRFPPTVAGLEQTTQVIDQTWSRDWMMRFFRTTEGTFNLRYNPLIGNVRIQEINQNGTFGDVKYTKDGSWLYATTASGQFDWDTTGWDTIEVYQARDAGVPIVPSFPDDLGNYGPNTEEEEQFTSTIPHRFGKPVEIKRAQARASVVRGALQLDWKADDNVLYVAETSTDLELWEPVEVVDGEPNKSLSFRRPLAATRRDADGNLIEKAQAFYRIRTIERAPFEPEVEVAPPRDVAPPVRDPEIGLVPGLVNLPGGR